jgi:hypothetical protein
MPVTKQLQILVDKSKLEISPQILKKKPKEENDENDDGLTRGIFNPCVSTRSKVLLYVRFTYRGIEKILVYDHLSTPKVTLPNDII